MEELNEKLWKDWHDIMDIDSSLYYDVNSSSFPYKDTLSSILKEGGLEIEDLSFIKELKDIEGWTLLRSREIPVLSSIQSLKISSAYPSSMMITIKGISELEDDREIRIKFYYREGLIQLFLCPEYYGTIWELEEARELFYEVFDKYVQEIIVREFKVNSYINDIQVPLGKVDYLPLDLEGLKLDRIDSSNINTGIFYDASDKI